MEACILCLEAPDVTESIDIFSQESYELDVCGIISKHFWIRPNKELDSGHQVCRSCWEAVRDFHKFYQQVVEAHNRWKSSQEFLSIDTDPLPCEVLFKSEEISTAGKLMEALGENFFDPDVKLEVHDLDILPQVELSDRAQRACRRGRPAKSSVANKRIKQEEVPLMKEPEDDSEPELPLAVLINADLKTESNTDPTGAIEAPENVNEQNSAEEVEPRKRRRGRQKKVDSSLSTLEASVQAPSISNVLEVERISENEAADEPAHFDGGANSGTDDSAASSSDSESDTNDWGTVDPPERYAQIPKRVVVKPKKYRKRPKPLLPPKRLTREELDRKKAQQAEYDKVIAQFFEKFSCPKCTLLVQNFGEISQHFRASHGSEPGYMTCCGRKFHQRKTLAEHVYVHWNPEHFKCATCGKVLQDARAMEVHEQSHANPPDLKDKKTYTCDKCPKAFTTKAAFEYHSFSKHVPKSEFRFTCTECNKKLPTERKLKDHIKYMHDPESLIICDKCGKQVRSQSNLKKHHEIEHSESPRPTPVPMQCEICGTWLRHLAGLKQHMKTIHEDAGGEHRCHICNKTSTNARALKRHIYHNHECERKFKCTMCEKAFKRPQDLREHTSTHTGEVLYTCPNCPMTFFSNANMYKHRQRLHRAEWEADKKKPVPPNIMQQAVGATAAMKMQQAVGAASAFFAHKHGANLLQSQSFKNQ